MGYNNAAGANRVYRDDHRKYFLPRVNIKDYDVLIDGRSLYDQNISDEIKMYDEVRKTALGKGDDYSAGCLLDFLYYKDHFKLVFCDLSKQAVLDSVPRAIQQIEFVYRLDDSENPEMLTVSEKEKQTILEFSRGSVKVW